MKKLINPNLSLQTIRTRMEKTVSEHLTDLDNYGHSDRQKATEICQLGKLLVSYFPEFSIEEVREEPDFIISDGKERIAVEHQTVLDESTKSRQGFYENIFLIAERDLRRESSLPNFLADCYLKADLAFKSSDKNKLIRLVKDIVTEFVINSNLPVNPLIQEITLMSHSTRSLKVNFGAYMVKDLNSAALIDSLNKKENKIESYRQNTGLKQWLLLVTSSAEEYSFDIEQPIQNLEINSKFDKVYLMTDHENGLYELK